VTDVQAIERAAEYRILVGFVLKYQIVFRGDLGLDLFGRAWSIFLVFRGGAIYYMKWYLRVGV
jgi:hypothetical protein